MKWSKKGEQKEDKCYNHDHYFVCGHPSVDCSAYTAGGNINIKSDYKEACSADKICVNAEGSFSCMDVTSTTSVVSTSTTLLTTTSATTTETSLTTSSTETTSTTTTSSETTTGTNTSITITTTDQLTSIATTTLMASTLSTSTMTTSKKIETDCYNEAWEPDENGQCRPKDEYFAIRCSPDGIEISIDSYLVPDAISFTFGSCPQKLDFDKEGRFIFKTPLDGCSTSIAMKNDKLVFSNTIREKFHI